MNKPKIEDVAALFHYPSQEEQKKNLAYCHVCLSKTNLTKEHIPPQSAFNDAKRLWERLILIPSKQSLKTKRDGKQNGFWVRTLCRKCNSEKGAPYAEEYVNFVKDLVASPQLFAPTNDAKLFNIKANTFYIAKEITMMILANEPLSFAEENEELRKFVLNKKAIVKPPFQILAFLVPDVPEAGTISQKHYRIDTMRRGFAFNGGEISLYPFGFVYADKIGEGYEIKSMTDITHWFTTSASFRVEKFYTRITGIDSLTSIHNKKRALPQINHW